ncbi:MAG: hypothetical protein JXX14_23235 [Deltaproteobacteria bacterium]|nr:hypothetical protein [Deltaproteobacteria bacterium]
MNAQVFSAGFSSKIAEIKEEIDLEFLKEELLQSAEQSLDGLSHIARVVLAMKEFSHPGEKDKKSLSDINHALDTCITISKSEWKMVADVTTDFDKSLPSLMCYISELNQVFINIIVNAAHALEGRAEKGTIHIKTFVKDELVCISISDNGTGIPEETKLRIFDPFFTTKEVGKGTGQGLSVAHSVVVDKHGGHIHVSSEEGKGTTFTIGIPQHIQSSQ